MPRGFNPSIEEFAEKLHRWFIVVQADGSVDACSDDPVHVGVVYDESGYGPHTASLYVDQNRFHASQDSALQAADEMHEEWMRDHYDDHLKELMEERLAEHVKDYLSSNPGASNEDAIEAVQDEAYQEADEWFREGVDGMSWTMTADAFIAALDSWHGDKYTQVILDGVSITRREECEELPEVDDPGYNVVNPGHPRMSSTRQARRRGVQPYVRREPKPRGYLYSITYEVVSDESAAAGEAEARGYEVEDVQVNTLQDLVAAVDSYGWIEDSGRWLDTEPEQDMHSGDYTSYSLHVRHLDGTELSRGEYRRLKSLLGVR